RLVLYRGHTLVAVRAAPDIRDIEKPFASVAADCVYGFGVDRFRRMWRSERYGRFVFSLFREGNRTSKAGSRGGGIKRAPRGRPFGQLSRTLLSLRLLLGCLSLRSALASIWRIRSRVTENCWPTSSSVWSVFMPMPKRMRRTRSSRGVSEART